jgi:hypothetical protein
VIDFADSEDEYEAWLGQFLLQQTGDLDGEPFFSALRRTLDGMKQVIDRFDEEWKVVS